MVALSFAASFGSHMVLQQAPARASLWGFAPASATAVAIELAADAASTPIAVNNFTAQASLARFNATALVWSVLLPAVAAQKRPDGSAVQYSVTARMGSEAHATLLDVLFGEVWLCSGQSNMAFLVENSFGGADLVQDANNHPEIRLFTTRKLTAQRPLQELGESTNRGDWVDGVELPWSVASNVSISMNAPRAGGANDDNWLYMSAVCYLFGRALQAARKTPIGLISTNWGGTAIQDWMPPAALDDCRHVSADAAAESLAAEGGGAEGGGTEGGGAEGGEAEGGEGGVRAAANLSTCLPCCEEPLPGQLCCCPPPGCAIPPSCPPPPALAEGAGSGSSLAEEGARILAEGVAASRVATHLYNAMVSPLRNVTLAGVVWYQGESNGGAPVPYACQLPALVKRWREGWGGWRRHDHGFAFGVVQLAGDVDEKAPIALPIFRWLGQTQGFGSLPNTKMPNTFLASAFDLGDAASPFGSVHSRHKKEVGERLALAARRWAYREPSITAGPILQSAVADAGRRRVVLTFREVGPSGLVLSRMNTSRAHNMTNWDGTTPFEVCADGAGAACGAMSTSFDGAWSLAPRTSLGADGKSIVLSGFADGGSGRGRGGRAEFPPAAVRLKGKHDVRVGFDLDAAVVADVGELGGL
ncbi:hypothetical protein EMIHUDRAFT_104986 [Emiliania huxleyi CCMP1516]|uniref:Sialate O-acetylesterase domain-containing protein n=2 Tax=Emiliania huxleyi TaxID=2903 RepID=A0A0D3II17_EMIH1|nr:hypothetical protein EMIHUDRAFT_104986 [Emiliania huxleyi CCMP1516]EOD10902.1 hypothetical protein EMIHUDRAFT_104986 [Emiliania huxleyi CCMP1516]|eukprot:XP_005763331.1 hypothetical protein EMIHUDRAFT_104986 [Emiliania huxleyi CCMP1516]